MDRLRHPVGACPVPSEDPRPEPELGVVGHGDALFLGLELQHRHHGTKQLDPGAPDALVRAGQQRRLEVPAHIEPLWSPSARAQGRSLGHRLGDDGLAPVALGLRCKGAHLRLGIEGIADSNRLGPPHHLVDEVAVHPRLHEYAGACHATLAAGAEVAGHGTIDGTFEVGVVEDEDRRLAPEFQRQVGEVVGRVADHVACGLDASRERHPADQRVAGERPSARFAEAGDEVEHTRWEPGFVDESGEFENRRRGLLRGLDDHRIARRQGRCGLCGG